MAAGNLLFVAFAIQFGRIYQSLAGIPASGIVTYVMYNLNVWLQITVIILLKMY